MNVRLNILMVRTPKTDFDRINVYRGFAASPVSQRSDSSTAWCCRQLGLHREIEFTQVQLDLRLLIFSHHSNSSNSFVRLLDKELMMLHKMLQHHSVNVFTL